MSPQRDEMERATSPRFAEIQPISSCDANCVMCPLRLESPDRPRGRMHWALVERVIEELAGEHTIEAISPMLQCEPLLDARLERIARLAKDLRPDIAVRINTNGSLLDAKRLESLADAGLDSLIFSLNALTEETFRKVQPGLDWATVMANLDNLIEHRPAGMRVAVKAMAIRENVVEMAAPKVFSDLVDRLEAAGIPFGADAISNRAGALEGYEEMLVFEHTQSSKRKRLCRDPFDTVNVLWNGDVIVCCADWSRASVIGNLGRQSLQEIWDGPEAWRRREMVLEGRYDELEPCRHCSQAWNIMENLKKG